MSYSTEIVKLEEIKTYHRMYHSEILDIFGMELTYHTLKYYTKDTDDYTQVMTSYICGNNGYRFKVWLGTDLVLDEIYGMHHSSDMNYKLSEYESRCDEEDELYREEEEA